ncbi:hypothetical protein HS1genome_0883 [Sulfodiicoccus acidiphilus]|jgi:uncharacterized protein (DUF1778 family)|uniref:CopG family transcriptional regulator n=1 Tax=Sulfodiicoccus acidiphilus TaxID=1670455 RepID=A0A348B2U2_9CREN|nr:hypothetical protein [Sulfodiicoccus acidiphilus]BBD72494.1 hypothetical protein HS1genome_0883 [Sulfodiicoccus acidiphilus]GGT96725.1 hypothetical protein GCM10007116_12770 [Sulfodiicoccus acidiphilus]
MAQSTKKRRVNLYLDEDVYYVFKTMAAVEKRRLNDLFSEAIMEYAKRKGEEIKKMMDAVSKIVS